MPKEEPKTAKDQGPTIIQPTLAEPTDNQQVAKTAGLRFLIPRPWKAGDVLDAESAAFINAGWRNAVLNRFGVIRKALLADPKTTYEIIDEELQAFCDSFLWTPRQLQANPRKPGLTDEEQAIADLITFARPRFRRAMEGHNLDRAAYEKKLRSWVESNVGMLTEMRDRARQDEAFIALGVPDDLEL